jgi:Domain of unknown function (DUF756)
VFTRRFLGFHRSGRRAAFRSTTTCCVNQEGGYDLTVVGPNRFERRFAGNVTTAGAAAQVTAGYYTEGGGQDPALTLTLGNYGDADLTFIVMLTSPVRGNAARTYWRRGPQR